MDFAAETRSKPESGFTALTYRHESGRGYFIISSGERGGEDR